MEDNNYPIISPNITFSKLNSKMSLLVNTDTFNTKVINKYQTMIINMCNGQMDLCTIIKSLSFEHPSIYKKEMIDKFISKMLSMGYLQLSPVKVVLNIPSLQAKSTDNNDYFMPSQLHTITVSITESCCMNCSYCSQSAPFGKGKEISFEKIKLILDDAYGLGARYFGVFGGEPLLHPDIFNIVQHAYSIGYRDVIIFTKGTLITEEKAKTLKSIGINRIQLSCDSHIPEIYDQIVRCEGAFSNFFSGVYYLLSVGIHIQLKIVITNKNIDSALETIKYFVSNGITDINLEVVVPVGRADFEIMPSSEKIYSLDMNIINLKKECMDKYGNVNFKYNEYGKPKSCAGGIGSIMIFTDGTVTPCDKIYKFKDIINFGNIFDNSLEDIWRNGNYNKFRNLSSDPICRTCDKSLICRGGCPLNNLILNGKLGESDIACAKISGKNQGILFID